MAILELVHFPNPILSKKAETVKTVTPELLVLAQDMIETMYDAPGVGLAANQIGRPERLAVIDTRSRDKKGEVIENELSESEKKLTFPLILFNLEILKTSGQANSEEGCLSVPGYIDLVKRHEFVTARAMNEKGETVEIEADGLLAICLQHECDHLDGNLFIDRLSPIRRNMLKQKIKKHGYPKYPKGRDPSKSVRT
ncbi:MAG: peptide deformylase [Bdellovibrionales bacterium]